jgi:hypothetical protein
MLGRIYEALRQVVCLAALCMFWAGTAHAHPEEVEHVPSVASPQSAVGGGVGALGLLHVDYRRWITPGYSVEALVSPVLVWNLGLVGLTRHVPVSSTPKVQRNVVFSATAGGVVFICCGTYGAVGGQLGYEWLSKTRGLGIGVTAGALYLPKVWPEDLGLLPDVRITVWRIRR